tara:strand:+ start:337 stop:561 length:225 start_codon:yes stop_codon:yes gene_type:complete
MVNAKNLTIETKIENFKIKALNNWFTKQFINESMSLKQMVRLVHTKTNESGYELQFDRIILDIVCNEDSLKYFK